MQKLLLACVTLLFFYSGVALARPNEKCQMRMTGEHEVQIQVGERMVHIVGWLHLDQQDIDVLREGFNSAMKSLNDDQCFMSKNSLTAALSKQSQDVKAAQNVFRRLQALHAQKPLSYIGLEATPSELSENLNAMRSIQDGIQALQVKCGSLVGPEASSFGLILPGPEYAFNTAYQGGVVLRALEDEVAKTTNYRQISSQQSKKQILIGLKGRNKAIAKNALAQEGSGAIVVGQLHVADLAQEMVRQCQSLP